MLLAVLALLVQLGALKRPGLVTGAFLLGYGVARTICEFFREPDAQLGFLWGGLTMGMLLCIPLILAGVAVIAFACDRARPRPSSRQQWLTESLARSRPKSGA